MGHTHYWTGTVTLDADTVKDALSIFDAAAREGIVLRGPLGVGCPIVSADEITFNGDADADEDHETFSVDREGIAFPFCKTARKPYDAVVVAILSLLESRNPGFHWSSDGEEILGDFDAGWRLLDVARVSW